MSAASASAQLDYYSEIDGAQSPSGAPGSGSATIVIDTAANTLAYDIVFSGLLAPETVAHIHGAADPGVSAGALHQLPPGSPKIGVWNYAEAFEANILAGRMYINIHSQMFPFGELRGQIEATPISYCTTDPCPCANPGGPGEGCRNGTGSGSELVFSGLPSVILDTLTLTATNLPPGQFAIIYNGQSQQAIPFGNGLRCVGGPNVNRFPVQPTGAGSITQGPGIVAFSVASFPPSSHITAGSTWNFQGWYRDPGGPCGASFNLSAARSISFGP